MNILSYIIAICASTVGVSSVVIYIGRRIIDQSLNLGIERYKGALNKELETHRTQLQLQTEEFKSNLQKLGLEHQIRFTKLHEERGQSIKEIYGLLVALQNKLEHFTTMSQGPEWTVDQIREKAAREAYQTLASYFQINQLYFPNSICNQIEEILELCKRLIVDMSLAKMTGADESAGQFRTQAVKEWREVNKRVSSELISAKQKLQAEFKKVLGVE
jgi:hypothetical protein